ncbi:MAG: carbohydrate kinase family protein [Actinomycetota bacterium]
MPEDGSQSSGHVLVVGQLLVDVVVALRGPIAPGAQVLCDINLVPGGAAANVARCLAGLGRPVRLVCQVGDDVPGKRLEEQVASTHVDMSAIVRGRTGVCIVLVDANGERSFLTDLGDSIAIRPTDIPGEVMVGASAVYISGYMIFWEPSRQAALDIAREARRLGIPVITDLASSSHIRDFGGQRFRELLDQLSPRLVFGNRLEAESAGTLTPKAKTVLVITGGREPTMIVREGFPNAYFAVPSRVVLNSRGGGDAMVAGFLHQWLARRPLPDCVENGHRLAEQVLSRAGVHARRR